MAASWENILSQMTHIDLLCDNLFKNIEIKQILILIFDIFSSMSLQRVEHQLREMIIQLY